MMLHTFLPTFEGCDMVEVIYSFLDLRNWYAFVLIFVEIQISVIF